MDTILIMWIILAFSMIIIDILTSGFLFVWFSIGACAAVVVYLLGGSVISQVIVFIIVSIICFAVGYPLSRKLIKKTVKRIPLMEENYIGREMIAENDIVETGRIKVGGIYWTAKNIGHPIKSGEKFTITSIEGNKFLIKNK